MCYGGLRNESQKSEVMKKLFRPIGTRGKFVFFLHISNDSILINSVKFQVNQLQNKKSTIYCSALSYKQEGASSLSSYIAMQELYKTYYTVVYKTYPRMTSSSDPKVLYKQ